MLLSVRRGEYKPWQRNIVEIHYHVTFIIYLHLALNTQQQVQ